MQDVALYQYLLGLKSPWTGSREQPGGPRATHGHVGRAFGARDVDVPSLREGAAALRPRRGGDVAALGQLSVPDLAARAHSSCGLRRAWRGAGPGAVGRTAVAVHAALRSPGYLRAASMGRERRHADLADQLGRSGVLLE